MWQYVTPPCFLSRWAKKIFINKTGYTWAFLELILFVAFFFVVFLLCLLFCFSGGGLLSFLLLLLFFVVVFCFVFSCEANWWFKRFRPKLATDLKEYTQRWFGLVWFGGFYGISTLIGDLMPNPQYTYIVNIYDLWTHFRDNIFQTSLVSYFFAHS